MAFFKTNYQNNYQCGNACWIAVWSVLKDDFLPSVQKKNCVTGSQKSVILDDRGFLADRNHQIVKISQKPGTKQSEGKFTFRPCIVRIGRGSAQVLCWMGDLAQNARWHQSCPTGVLMRLCSHHGQFTLSTHSLSCSTPSLPKYLVSSV